MSLGRKEGITEGKERMNQVKEGWIKKGCKESMKEGRTDSMTGGKNKSMKGGRKESVNGGMNQ